MKIPKVKKSFVLLLCVIGFNSVLTGQDTLLSLIQNQYGGDMRIRSSYGLIPDMQIDNCIKIRDLDSKRIAIAVKFPQILTLTNNTILKDKSIEYPYTFNINNYLKEAILKSSAHRTYAFTLFEDKDTERLILNPVNGRLKLSKSGLDSLALKYNSDYLILIRGAGSTWFSSSKNNKSYQGLYRTTKGTAIYAGQVVSVYNLKTGKVVKNGSFPQESADVLPFNLHPDFRELTPVQLETVDSLMRQRLQNNLKQSFKLLGLW